MRELPMWILQVERHLGGLSVLWRDGDFVMLGQDEIAENSNFSFLRTSELFVVST